jgi:hypothetical protein
MATFNFNTLGMPPPTFIAQRPIVDEQEEETFRAKNASNQERKARKYKNWPVIVFGISAKTGGLRQNGLLIRRFFAHLFLRCNNERQEEKFKTTCKFELKPLKSASYCWATIWGANARLYLHLIGADPHPRPN